MSRKSVYEWGCMDSDCVMAFKTREEAEVHVSRCSGVLVVSRDDRPLEEVEA